MPPLLLRDSCFFEFTLNSGAGFTSEMEVRTATRDLLTISVAMFPENNKRIGRVIQVDIQADLFVRIERSLISRDDGTKNCLMSSNRFLP
uniref:Uncharacterized protein n=1 Tax=Ditylenchus dipsaci TaxID=166011 RepID=A0A915D656_9BILA